MGPTTTSHSFVTMARWRPLAIARSATRGRGMRLARRLDHDVDGQVGRQERVLDENRPSGLQRLLGLGPTVGGNDVLGRQARRLGRAAGTLDVLVAEHRRHEPGHATRLLDEGAAELAGADEGGACRPVPPLLQKCAEIHLSPPVFYAAS